MQGIVAAVTASVLAAQPIFFKYALLLERQASGSICMLGNSTPHHDSSKSQPGRNEHGAPFKAVSGISATGFSLANARKTEPLGLVPPTACKVRL